MSLFAKYSQELRLKKNHIDNLFPSHKVTEIIPSPKVFRYRNKINVSIGYNLNDEIEIGPMIKKKIISNPKGNYQLSEIALKIILFTKKWIIETSTLKPIEYPSLNQFWRHLTIYNTQTNQIMIVFHIQNINIYQEKWNIEYPILIEYLNKFISKNNYTLKSVYYQYSNGLKETRNNDKYYHIYGDTIITEKIDNLKFNLSPGSFFQVNPYTAKIIYNLIRELIINNTSTILDICSGIGIISMFVNKLSNKIYAIESSKSSIDDAKINLLINDISNVTLINNKAELVLPILVKQLNTEIIAIINPPRRGIYSSVIDSLKKIKLKQIIYVSCNSESAKKDLERLEILPEQIKNIIPIDQFPWSSHYETIFNIVF